MVAVVVAAVDAVAVVVVCFFAVIKARASAWCNLYLVVGLTCSAAHGRHRDISTPDDGLFQGR